MSARDVKGAVNDAIGKSLLRGDWPSERAQTVLAALDAAGYAVVPKEPTEAMTEAASGAWYQHRSSTEMYRAMLTAAKDPT
jgi:hypothetical protein